MSFFDEEKLAILATSYCAPVAKGNKIGIVGNVAATSTRARPRAYSKI